MNQNYKDSEGKWRREGDLPIKELADSAEKVILDSGGTAKVYFKFTCENCGERCTFDEERTIFEFGECCTCGHNTKITEGGYALHFII